MEFRGEKYRITVLTDRLVRLEYSEEGRFEDRPSFAVTCRDFSRGKNKIDAGNDCDFEVLGAEASVKEPVMRADDSEDKLTIETEYLLLTYDKKQFSSCGLSIFLKNMGTTWNFGDNYTDWSNLGGTARTLDDADGRVCLEKGIFGKDGYAAIDDSKTPVMENGEFVNRPEGMVDVYFFGYGRDYYGGLRDFCRLSGRMPMIPRYALGNWWSRYFKYTEDSYMEVVDNFAKEGIPLSVAVIDMDWHITEVDPKYGSGWTGYTWNKEFFPDYKRFLKKLHDNNLAVTLNLHPADGIRPFEAMYDDMARAMGCVFEDPHDLETEADKNDLERNISLEGKDSEIHKAESGRTVDSECIQKKTIEFDFGDKKFRDAYFETVMHPYEEDGVDFWWIDWQQGTGKKPGDVDPLLLLNHYHYEDQKKRNLRPMIFSRYAGVGSHRYPVGFSGDTHVTWKSLEFQPYFTSTASNIGYGMWSHDIGGHMLGDKNLDRLIRWIEYGVFSPIMRIHSSCSPFFNKEPWLLDEPYRAIVKKFMKLRHELIPYLYTENHRAYAECKPLVRPMYYDYADDFMRNEIYNLGNQYKFGDNLLVSAITAPNDDELRLGCTRAYIPSGRWYDIFNGRIYEGQGIKKLYRELSEIPVLLPAGGIVPLAINDANEDMNNELNESINDNMSIDENTDVSCHHGRNIDDKSLNFTGNPSSFRILIGGGASGEYTLYEDDGISMNFEKGEVVETRFATVYDETSKTITFTIHSAEGDLSLIPEKRNYELVFYGVKASHSEATTFDGKTTKLCLSDVSTKDGITCTIENVELLHNDYHRLIFELLDRAWIKTTDKDMIYDKLCHLDRKEFADWIRIADIREELKNAICENLYVLGQCPRTYDK
ncbi:MAG: DUF5110 domain-containing protein [Butyrivibrio sp.]|nr:DUF5110 domain-containing protein [Butyrivibrio sp.]